MYQPTYKPETIPGYVFSMFFEKNEYEQLPVFDPEHEYRVTQCTKTFVPIAFKDYDSAVKYINQHYPEAKVYTSPFHFYAEEGNDIQITAMLDIYIQQCCIVDKW